MIFMICSHRKRKEVLPWSESPSEPQVVSRSILVKLICRQLTIFSNWREAHPAVRSQLRKFLNIVFLKRMLILFQGATYKFIVRTESKSFANAPPAILRVLKRCSWAAEGEVTRYGGVYEEPNELLTLGYTECGEMGVSKPSIPPLIAFANHLTVP